MRGGIGPSPIDATWVHGDSDDSILRTIETGVPDTGMPGFGSSLTESERRGLLALIREKGTDYIRTRTIDILPFPTEPQASRIATYRVETVIDTELETPWPIVFLSTDTMLVSERPLSNNVQATVSNARNGCPEFYS